MNSVIEIFLFWVKLKRTKLGFKNIGYLPVIRICLPACQGNGIVSLLLFKMRAFLYRTLKTVLFGRKINRVGKSQES